MLRADHGRPAAPSAHWPDPMNDRDTALVGLSIVLIAFGVAYLIWQWMGASLMPSLGALGL